jgi:two-component system cell cycle sensor histidine kinase/response regulator CckA
MKSEVKFGLEAAAWPAWLVNASGVMLRVNEAAATVFGAALAGDAPQLSAIWSAENNGVAQQFLTNWERSPVTTASLKLRIKGGEVKPFTVAICSFTQDGQKYFIWQLPPESGVSDANLMNKQKLDCALQLARTISLDFNNALTSILGHTSLLLGKAEANHPWRRSLLEVEKSAAQAAEIAHELVVFSRQEKEPPLQPSGNLNLVAQRCVDFFNEASGAKITWRMQLERELFAVRFDEAKMQQALMKILENSVEAIAGGGGRITLQSRNVVLTEPTQDRDVRLAANTYVCIEVSDNGGGIAPDVLPRIFEPFFTTKGGKHRGLGLALVYGIVANHGGGVAVSSHPGTGTSARIYVPAEKQFVQESVVPGENLRGTETVLMVDDESLMLTMGETILGEYGYKVLTASSGPSALAILARADAKVDLVVTDLVMPGMGGRELMDRIWSLQPAMRILCTSGYEIGAEKRVEIAYLQKPFTSAELLSKVKHTLLNGLTVD